MAGRNAAIAGAERIEFRIGMHQGDIVVEDGDIFGDGVNVAGRLEALADPGRICVSARVQEDAAGRLDLVFDDLGEQSLKNIARPVRVYRVRAVSAPAAPTQALPLPASRSLISLRDASRRRSNRPIEPCTTSRATSLQSGSRSSPMPIPVASTRRAPNSAGRLTSTGINDRFCNRIAAVKPLFFLWLMS